MRCFPLLVAIAFLSAVAVGQDRTIRFARGPHVANDGRIAFSYQGDLWTVRADGSQPVHVTAHPARDAEPRFSPDGRWIAFRSDRAGNDDVWVVGSTGGEPQRLTFHSTGDRVQYWTPDGDGIVFSTSRGALPWSSPLYVVPRDGGLPVAIEMGSGAAGMFKQDGSMLAFNRTPYRHPKKHYRGSGAVDVWIKDVASGAFTQLTDTDLRDYKNNVNDAYPMWGVDGNVYFMSERSGTFNIWRIAPTGGTPEQVTFHARDGVQFPSISPDGRTIVYSNEFELWTLAVPDGEPRKVSIELPIAGGRDPSQLITTQNRADGFAPSPDGESVAVDYHGEIFVVPAEAGFGEIEQVTSSPWRERSQTWSPDGRYLAYLSDESGDDEIWLREPATGARRKLTTQPSKKEIGLWSNDSKQLLFTADNAVQTVDVADGTTRRLALDHPGGVQVSAFSADGKWLVVSHSDAYQNSEVYLYDIENGREHNVTDHPARDSGGRLTPDGKKLVFRSNRDDGADHLFVVSLAKRTEDPDDPRVKVRERKAAEAAGGGRSRGGRGRRGSRGARGRRGAEADPAEAAEAPAEADEPQAPIDIHVDADGIDRRAEQLTSGSDAVSTFFLSKDGETVYYVVGGGGRGGRRGAPPPPSRGRGAGSGDGDGGPGLYAIGIDGEGKRKLTDGSLSSVTPTADGEKVFFRQRSAAESRGAAPRRGRGAAPSGGDIYWMDLGERAKTRVTFDLKFEVDLRAQWSQMFDEFYRHWKYSYVEQDMHGFDWESIRARYEPLVAHIGETDDFYDLVGEMLAELNCSHSGVSRPRPAAGSGSSGGSSGFTTRLLGFEMEPADGGYRVTHVYRDGPADREWVDLEVGDRVLALDGQELAAGDNYWRLLNRSLNDYVTVEVSRPGAEKPHEVRIETVTSLRDVKYEEWIADNRDLVDELSGGRIAYLHIRAMNQAALEKFKNEIDQFFYKKGAIIDVRYNGGGNIDQELMDILERRPYQYTWNKTSSVLWGRRPKQTIHGPKVMMTNWRSGSDAEMTPHGFRHLGLGRLVGTPTVGAVVSARRYTLLDGGSVRIPGTRVVSYDPTMPDNHGFDLENYGVPPDVWVRNSPKDEIDGRKRELEVAVQEVLRMLESGEGRWTYEGPSKEGGAR